MTEKSFGRYQITKELGRGGMAVVYLAHDPRFKRDVALKVLPYHFAHDPQFKARFEREAETIAALEHPAIVTVYDFGEDHDQPYFVMRPMLGGSLADRLTAGPMPLSEIVVILKRVGSALDRAHSLGIVHRDLKPGNILFDQYGDAYLADFGIVHIAESTQLTGTRLIGTPAYMSPEQAQGSVITGSSDIYTLGIILFEMLSGEQPYQATTPMGILYKQVHDPVPQLHDRAQTLAPSLNQVISRAMAKNPAERYATAAELAAAVDAIQKGQPATIASAEATPETAWRTLNLPDEALPLPAAGAGSLSEEVQPGEAPTVLERPMTPEPAAFAGSTGIPAAGSAGAPRRSGRALWLPVIAFLGIACVAVVLLLILAAPRLGRAARSWLDGEAEQTPIAAAEPPAPTGPSILEMVQSSWAKGFRVTSLGAGDGVWAAILSQDSPFGRQTWAARRAFPSDFIQETWRDEYRVTSLTNGGGLWAVVMSQDSPYGRQTYATREAFPSDYIREQWDAGLRATSLAYGDGQWAVVLSENTPYGRQVFATREQFPSDFIEARWADGFRVTGIAYGNGLWAVIMSQDSPFGRQTWATRAVFPEAFIEENVAAGFRVTDLARGDGVWTVILSQGSPYNDQIWHVR